MCSVGDQTDVSRVCHRVRLAAQSGVVSAQYAVDFAALQVKVAEGALLPSLNAQGTLQRANEPTTQIARQKEASIGLAATAPIYQGGAEYAAVRQAKEVLARPASRWT